jgi:hypothetical protein
MPQKFGASIQNNFNQGLKTEFTGLNFPENACTETSNCVFERIGNVHRRSGFDFEVNGSYLNTPLVNNAISTFVWTNVGGDGETKIYVLQVGGTLYFYQFTNATLTNPMSHTILGITIDIFSFVANTGTFDATKECQFASGNGFLFVYHPSCDPFFCTYNAGNITGTVITVQIRDFLGIPEPGVAFNYRPLSLSAEHEYNLENQGWTIGEGWSATSSTIITLSPGSYALSLTGIQGTPNLGDQFFGYIGFHGSNGHSGGAGADVTIVGTVAGYVPGVSLTVGITTLAFQNPAYAGLPSSVLPDGPGIIINQASAGLINTWHSAIGNYPSNSDIWWLFKNSSDIFDPAATVGNVTTDTSQAPQGHFILNAFQQQRSAISGIAGLTDITTTVRPTTGTWFEGRVFYAGVNAASQASGDAFYYTWTENIYFSQIITPGDSTSFGNCYEINDPTSETLSDILPSDGGVIVIQGSGAIYKLFPVVNGLLVFAANGIWFITGSQGIGFTATDYTITKLSGIQSISGTSYVDVLGYPVFWNEESIYSVSPSKEGQGLAVNNLGLTTINSFFADIPLSSKQYARGSYNPLTYEIQWVYNSNQAVDIITSYNFNSVLVFNTITNAFYPWAISEGNSIVHDVTYIVAPGGSNTSDPVFKYLASKLIAGVYNMSFAEEMDDTNWVDWFSTGTPLNYTSTFTTGYALHGEGYRKFQPSYINVYSNNLVNTSYIIQGVWDYALQPDSGKYSSKQLVQNYISTANFNIIRRRHRIRGNGYVLQYLITSVPGQPFDIIGWSVQETQNASA